MPSAMFVLFTITMHRYVLQAMFERDLGAKVLNEFEHYAAMEAASADKCCRALACAALQ